MGSAVMSVTPLPVAPTDRPRVIVTGASGFLGRRIVKLLRNRFHVIALDRRTRGEAAIAHLSHVEWHTVDIADKAAVAALFEEIAAQGGARALVHLAAWYDFTGKDHVEYTRTNVDGTRLLLEHAEPLRLQRFIFASSIAACDFFTPGHPITEDSPPNADHFYARSKRAGEELMQKFADRIPTAIVRLAALFSDWCEYPPLYVFFETWLSRGWNRSILGGKGRTSVPYLHVRDAAECFAAVIDRDDIKPAEIFLASADGAVSHRQLFDAVTAYAEKEKRKPILVPRWLAQPGMWLRDIGGRLIASRPFEQPWMARYLDTELVVDAQGTRDRLGWAPRPRLGVLHRIPFLLENRRTGGSEWLVRNREAMEHVAEQENYLLFRLLEKHQEDIEASYQKFLMGEAGVKLQSYTGMDDDERRWGARVVMRNLIHAVRNGERTRFMQFSRDMALRRSQQGFAADDLIHALKTLNWICLEKLSADPAAAALGAQMHDLITVTLDFGVDRIQEVYEDAAAGAWY